MPDYGLYRLSNSTEIPRFPGSVVPELTKAAAWQQEKYDTAMLNDELLQQALKTSQVREADMPAYKALSDEMADRMKQRAAKGDYENMVRETTRDARTFAQRYAPFVENRKREASWLENLDKLVADNKISKKTADMAKQFSMYRDKGLSYDPRTGQYSGHFQGYMPADDINLSDEVHKALQGINPKVFGTNVRRIVQGADGEYYKEEGNRTVKLNQAELWPHVKAYFNTNDRIQSYLGQQRLFSSYRFGDEEELRRSMDPVQYEQFKEKADALGMPVGKMLQEQVGNSAVQNILDAAYQLTGKYTRNDQETESKLMGLTERSKKALDEGEDVSFVGPIQVNLPGSAIATPKDAAQAIIKADEGINSVRSTVEGFVKMNGVKAGPTREIKNKDGTITKLGSYVTADGQDITAEMNNMYGMMRQAQATADELKARDEKIRKDVGLVLNKTIMEEADKKYWETLRRYEKPMGKAETIMPETERVAKAEAAKQAYLEENHPRYKEYKAALALNAQNESVMVGVRRFKNPKANKAMDDVMTTLQQDLDLKGLNHGMLGLQDMKGNMLKDEDYSAVRAKSTFAGYYKSPATGEYMLTFKVGDTRYNSKGQPVGEPKLVQMKAGPDVYQYLIKTGEVDMLQDAIGTEISQIERSPMKTVTIPLPGGIGTANARRIEAHERNAPGVLPGAQFVVEYNINGQKELRGFEQSGQIVNHMYDYMKRINDALEKEPKK